MSSPFDPSFLASKQRPAPPWHFEKIAAEIAEPDKARMLRVISRMGAQQVPAHGAIDWDAELAAFGAIEFPSYYLQPFHSIPGGYLNEAAALGDRAALDAIYEDAHPEKSLGLRRAIATLVPADARAILDLGCGTGDGGAAIARRLPSAQVLALDASPFMVIVGRRQNGALPNLRIEQGFAERCGAADASIDAIHVTLVFHACPNAVKRAILAECLRALRPGGTLVLSDTAQDDLHSYCGFYEPYKDEWLRFDPDAFLLEAGFTGLEGQDVAAPLWTRVARKPA